MQALNLRPEPVAPKINATEQRTSQGVSRSSQDESSFEVALRKAQKELEEPKETTNEKFVENQNATETTEGKNNIISQKEKTEELLSDFKELEDLFVFDADDVENLKLSKTEPVIETGDFTLEFDNFLTKTDSVLDETEVLLDEENLVVENSLEPLALTTENLNFWVKGETEIESTEIQLNKKLDSEEKDNSQEILFAVLTGQSELSKNDEVQDFSNLNQQNIAEFSQEVTKMKTSKEKKQPVISIVDERTVIEDSATSNFAKEQGNFVTTISQTGDNSAQMSMNLTPNAQQNIQFEGIVNSNATQSSNFSAMLSSEIQNNAFEFVKAGSMVLKDNKSGTINLILHPEELGSVKIQLELSDKLIAGKIVVATKEAYDAFKSSMSSLQEAFNSSGFETSGFDLSWSGEDKSSNSEDNRNFHGFNYEKNVTEFVDDSYGIELVRDTIMYGSSLVNMMA